MSQHHILIIEDDAPFRNMLGTALECEGYRVTLAENGNLGIKAFLADPADVVVTDVIMPEKEGIETIIDLKKDHPDIKIIAMSGGAPHSKTYLKMCAQLGAEATLAKPFSLATLNSTLKAALGVADESE